LSAAQSAAGLRAAVSSGLPGFSHRGSGGVESLEGHLPGVPSRRGGRVPALAGALAAVSGALVGGGGALFSGAAPGTVGRRGRSARLLWEAGRRVGESLLRDAGTGAPQSGGVRGGVGGGGRDRAVRVRDSVLRARTHDHRRRDG